jgi:hypothetical protein
MKREAFDVEWCREKLRLFADMERVKVANQRELNELAAKYAGCPKVVPKPERKVAA